MHIQSRLALPLHVMPGAGVTSPLCLHVTTFFSSSFLCSVRIQSSKSGFIKLTSGLSMITLWLFQPQMISFPVSFGTPNPDFLLRRENVCDHPSIQNDVIISDLSENLPWGFWPSFKNLMDVRTWSLQKKMNDAEKCYLPNYLVD